MTNFLEERKVNREHKNDLFVFLFGTNKEFALSLYNAMNNSNYTDPDSITFNTIENFIYIGKKNDVSFLIENTINVYEHQTTVNANIALRMLLYVSKLYERYAYENKKDLYSEKKIKLPNPNFVVFYYGGKQIEDDRFIYLSEAMDIKNSNLELRVRVINANYGHNQHILNKCPALYEYSWFLQEIRIRYNMVVDTEKKNNNMMTRIVDSVLEAMPDDFVIKEIITNHKAEVTDMLYTIEDEPRMMAIHEEALRNEGYEKGKKESRAEGLKTSIKLLLKAGFSIEEAEQMVKEEYSDVIEEQQKQNKEVRNASCFIEAEPEMKVTHEEALRNEGYEKGKTETRKKDLNKFIEVLMESGLTKEEAIRKVEEKFKE